MRIRPSSKPYELKIQDLHGQIEKAARELGNVQESKDTCLREIRELGEIKARIIKQIDDLNRQVEEKNLHLNEVCKREESFISSVKKELLETREKVNMAKEEFQKIGGALSDLRNVYNEIYSFTEREKSARMNFLEAQEKFLKANEEYQKVTNITQKEMIELQEKKKELDKCHGMLVDFNGRLSFNIAFVRETINEANEFMARNEIPVIFQLPPDQKIVIPFQ